MHKKLLKSVSTLMPQYMGLTDLKIKKIKIAQSFYHFALSQHKINLVQCRLRKMGSRMPVFFC
jgi:hypothetical protein